MCWVSPLCSIPCLWFLGGFFCKHHHHHPPRHAARNAHHPTKIRAISLWEGKALLILEHCAQIQGCTSGNQCKCFPKPKPVLLYLFVYHYLTFSFLSSLATDLFAKCFSSRSAPTLLPDPTGFPPHAPAMSHRSPHLAHELFTPFAGCLVQPGVIPPLILRRRDRLRTGSVVLLRGRGVRQCGGADVV